MEDLVQFTLLMGLAASLILQLFAAFLGVRLMRTSRDSPGWVFLSVALLCMAVRRVLIVYNLLTTGAFHQIDLVAELVAFLTSFLLVVGLFSILAMMRRGGVVPDHSAETPFGDLFENTTSGVAVYRALDKGRDFIIVDINPAAERIEKASRVHLTGRRLSEAFPGMEEFGLPEILRQVLKTGHSESFPLHYYQDGRVSGWRDSFVYRRAGDELVVVYSDVSVQMRMKEELERRERKFRILFEQAPLPYQVLDGDGQILEVNPAWFRLTGRDRKSVAGRPFHELLSRTGRQQFADALVGLHQRGAVSDMPLEMVRKDGLPQHVTMTALAQNSRTGTLEQIYCMLDEQPGTSAGDAASDVEQKARQLVLETQASDRRNVQQERLALFGELTTGLAYELNAPLTAARNAFSLMQQDLPPAGPHYEFAGVVLRELSTLAELVEQMYRFRTPAAQTCETLDLNALVDNTLILFHTLIRDRQIQIHDERAPGVPPVFLPPEAVMLTLMNPVKNSLEALAPGGILTLRTGPAGEGVFVEIEDNGPGIPPDFLPRLFEPFTTFRHSRTTGGGPGLGMAQLQHTLDVLGGSVEVQSHIGEGTCVRIILPAGLKSDA
jgi:PAS domain S-box-containing protein